MESNQQEEKLEQKDNELLKVLHISNEMFYKLHMTTDFTANIIVLVKVYYDPGKGFFLIGQDVYFLHLLLHFIKQSSALDYFNFKHNNPIIGKM